MFKIAFGLSLVLAVLKMIDVISCSWLMVLFPMLAVVTTFVVLCIITVVLIYIVDQKEDKNDYTD